MTVTTRTGGINPPAPEPTRTERIRATAASATTQKAGWLWAVFLLGVIIGYVAGGF